MVVRTHSNSNPPQKLEPKLIFPWLAYGRSTTVLPSITQTFRYFSIFCLFPIKRKCRLRSSRIENSWYMIKNQKFWYFVQIPYDGLRTWWHFFLEIYFWTPQKKIKIKKKVRAPRGVKNTKNWRDTCLQADFAMFDSHQLKPCFELRNGLLNCLQCIFQPSKTYVN